MTNINDEYYYFDALTAGGTYADTTIIKGAAQKNAGGYVENPHTMEYKISNYSKGKLADTHPGLLVSNAIAEKLQGLKNVQLIPATIEDKKKVVREGYNFINNYNTLDVCDMDASEHNYDDFLDVISMFEKIVLKEDLSKIPLEERLMFKVKYANRIHFIHQSIMEKILEANPKSAFFIKVSEYGKGQYW